jgi:hypothetical protein
MQISCLLGQIELEGKRPPIMIRSTLPLPLYLVKKVVQRNDSFTKSVSSEGRGRVPYENGSEERGGI